MSKRALAIVTIVLSLTALSVMTGQVAPAWAGFTPTPTNTPASTPTPPPPKPPKDTPTPTVTTLTATPAVLPPAGGTMDESGARTVLTVGVIILLIAGLAVGRLVKT